MMGRNVSRVIARRPTDARPCGPLMAEGDYRCTSVYSTGGNLVDWVAVLAGPDGERVVVEYPALAPGFGRLEPGRRYRITVEQLQPEER
jgi:hypothetical protein